MESQNRDGDGNYEDDDDYYDDDEEYGEGENDGAEEFGDSNNTAVNICKRTIALITVLAIFVAAWMVGVKFGHWRSVLLVLWPLYVSFVLGLLSLSPQCESLKPTWRNCFFTVCLIFGLLLGYIVEYPQRCRMSWKQKAAEMVQRGELAFDPDDKDAYFCHPNVRWSLDERRWCCGDGPARNTKTCREDRRLVGEEEAPENPLDLSEEPLEADDQHKTHIVETPMVHLITRHQLAAFCDPEKNPPVVDSSYWPSNTNSPLPLLNQMTCAPWTCFFTETLTAPDRYWTEGVLTVFLFVGHLINVAHTRTLLKTAVGGYDGAVNVWFAVCWIPNFIVRGIIWVQTVNIYSLITYFSSLLGFVLREAYFIVTTLLVMVVAAFVYTNRAKVLNALGLEDTNIFKWSYLLGGRQATEYFQVAIWKVSASYSGASGLKSMLGPQGSTYSFYVRLGYSDNEPQQSRIVSGKELRPSTEVMFKQIFNFNYESDLTDSPLYITLRRQGVLTSEEAGRLSISPLRLQEMLNRASSRRQNQAVEQIQEMMNPRPSLKEMRRLGFEEIEMGSGGGAIWIAVANVKM